MEKYWKTALSLEQYMHITQQRINNPLTDEDKEKQPYYELAWQRMNRMLKIYQPEMEQIRLLEEKHFKGKILLISEPWCGDASSSVPVIVRFFEGKNEVKIFLRDQDHSLINQFLTNGTQSIPKILILEEDFTVKNTWGPRTQKGNELLKYFKENPDTYSKDQFHHDLQVYYAKNRGKDTIDEILALL